MYTFLLITIACASVADVLGLAPSCDWPKCKLPDCRCSSTDIPGNLKASEIPQMVVLTFDDAVSTYLHNNFYKKLLVNRKNPNSCDIGITFFASHEYCDYSLVHDLWEKGHEIAVHSITHKADQNYWKQSNYKTWADEMVGMRTILETHAKIPRRDLKGIRVPFLQVGGNTQFEMMKKEGFMWDCSMPTRTQVHPGLWPYTLDYLSTQDCQIGPCPTESYPGTWVVPMLDLFEVDETPCAMLDTCRVQTADETYKLLNDNFEKHYNGNRAPFGLYVHAAWFIQDKPVLGHFDGYVRFLDKLKTMNNVYIVTVSQALEWTRNPKKLSEIKSTGVLGCVRNSSACSKRTCKLDKKDTTSGGERYMVTCDNRCPACYPWVGNTEGKC